MTSGLARVHEQRRQRAQGQLGLSFGAGSPGQAARLKTFVQTGCLRARLPRAQSPGWREAVTLNISGGIAGGDALATSIQVESGARVLVAGQAAERVYRAAQGEPARITTDIDVGPGASLEYLPQETIFYNGFALDRILLIKLAADAYYLGVEMQVFGRRSMGETLTSGCWRDCIHLIREGRIVINDRVRLEGAIEAQLSHPAIANGAVVVATLILAGPLAAAHLDGLREILHHDQIWAGASLVDGVLVARVLARSLHDAKRSIITALAVLRDGRPLPRVWQG